MTIKFKEKVILMLDEGPQHIAVLPPSSTGKYHPKDEHVQGGSILHAKRVAVFAHEVSRMYDLGAATRDVLIAGALIHDQFKYGGDPQPMKFTHKLHTFWAAEHVMKYCDLDDASVITEMIVSLANACLWHEGRWTDTDAVIAAVKAGVGSDTADRVSKCLHIADCLASKREIAEIMQARSGSQTQTEIPMEQTNATE